MAMDALTREQVFTDSLEKRWPGWRPTSTERNDWLRRMQKYDEDVFEVACAEHRYENEGLKPKMKSICTLAAEQQIRLHPESMVEESDRYNPTKTDTFVQCTKKGEHGPNVGHYHPVLICYRDGSRDYSPHRVRISAQKIVEQCEQLYGGTWRVRSMTTYEQMFQERHEAFLERKRNGREGTWNKFRADDADEPDVATKSAEPVIEHAGVEQVFAPDNPEIDDEIPF